MYHALLPRVKIQGRRVWSQVRLARTKLNLGPVRRLGKSKTLRSVCGANSSLERTVNLYNLEGTVKLPFSQILFQSNWCFVGIILLDLCFSQVFEICPKWEEKCRKMKRGKFFPSVVENKMYKVNMSGFMRASCRGVFLSPETFSKVDDIKIERNISFFCLYSFIFNLAGYNPRYKSNFFFFMAVENCNASCYWLHLHRNQALLSGFKVVLSQHGRLHAVSSLILFLIFFYFVTFFWGSMSTIKIVVVGKLWDYFTRYTNPQLVAKCEQILYMTSCEFDERAAKPKFVAKGDPISTIHTNKLIVHSLGAGSLLWIGYRRQRWQRQPRTGEAGEKNEARKSERARELLIFEFRPSRGSRVSITIQREQSKMYTNMAAHCTWRLSRVMVKLHGWRDAYQSHCDICHRAYCVTPTSGKIAPKTRYFGWKIASLS